MYMKSSICGIQHTCIKFFYFPYNYKNKVLACFQTRPSPSCYTKPFLPRLVYLYPISLPPPQGMEGGGSQRVWVSDPVQGFLQGTIIDLNPEGVTVQPITKGNSKPITVSYDRVYPAEDDDKKDVDDNCESRACNGLLCYSRHAKSCP